MTLDLFTWRPTNASTKHEDLFEETIRNGEVYFRRHVSAGWGDDIKLSRLPMKRILYALFTGNPGLEGLAKKTYKVCCEELREAHRRYSALSALFQADSGEDAE